MSKVTVRPATPKDIAAFVSEAPITKAWVGEVDGKIIGIGGLYFHKARWCVFCDLTDEARRYKLTIARTAKMVMDEARRMNIRFIYSDVDIDEPNARKWHHKLGFRLDPRSQRLMRWDSE